MAALSEFDVIDRYFRRPAKSAILGVGDDAALVSPARGCELAISVDMLVEGRHFDAGVDPESLGHKTLAVNLSDMAAMAAKPRWALLAGALPRADAAWLESFARGFFALADVHGVELIGGDTTRGPLNLCVTILGEIPAGSALRRAGARPGDSIWVTGRLGDAALALAHRRGDVKLDKDELEASLRALMRPEPRVDFALRLRGVATSAIDVSDGLAGDLQHLLRASGVGARIDIASLPRSAALERLLGGGARRAALQCLLAGGDDYELCFTAAPENDRAIAERARATGVSAARIGTIIEGSGLILRDERGIALSPPPGFDHFAV